MNNEEAHAALTNATANIDFINLAGILSQLGEQGFEWNHFHNAYFRYNYARALEDWKWFLKNSDEINEAIIYLYENRPKTRTTLKRTAKPRKRRFAKPKKREI